MMEPTKPEKPELVMIDLQKIVTNVWIDIMNSMEGSGDCSPNCRPILPWPPNDLDSVINPSCIVLDGKAISLDQISAPQLNEILQKIITVVAKPLILENRKQSTLVSVLTAKVQALEAQISKKK